MTLATSLYDWLLFLHILAAAIWLGGLVVISLLAALVLRSGDADLVRRFTGALRIIGPAVLALQCSLCWASGSGWSSIPPPGTSDKAG